MRYVAIIALPHLIHFRLLFGGFMPSPVESWLAQATFRVCETLQSVTAEAPAEVRAEMKPGEVDRAVLSRLMRTYGVQPANMVHAA